MAAPSNPFDGMVVMGGSSPPPASPYDNRAPEPEPTSPSSPGHLQQMPVSPQQQQQQQQQTSPGAKAAINGMVSGMGNMVMSADGPHAPAPADSNLQMPSMGLGFSGGAPTSPSAPAPAPAPAPVESDLFASFGVPAPAQAPVSPIQAPVSPASYGAPVPSPTHAPALGGFGTNPALARTPVQAPPPAPVDALLLQPQPQQQQEEEEAHTYSNYSLGSGPDQDPPSQVPPQANLQAPISPMPQQSQTPADPLGGPSPMTAPSSSQALTPASPAADPDPFGVFGGQQQPPPSSPPPPQQQSMPSSPPQQPPGQQNDDFWGAFSSDPNQRPASAAPAGGPAADASAPFSLDADGLPAGGEKYNARIVVNSLGVLFFKATDLTTSLFNRSNEAAVSAIGNRATVGHVFEGSAAEAAGLGLGDVLLRVNGQDAGDPEEATHLFKTCQRPLNLECWSPPAEHVRPIVWEGKHMVKYDDKATYAPQSKWEWKPKYVVVGGVVASPLQVNMYRSKAEYDTAVKEVQSGQTRVSVKVKQFSLVNADILLGRNGRPRTVDYPEEWHYFVIVPVEGFPIRIASTTIERLTPLLTGCKRALEDAEVQQAAHEESEAAYLREQYQQPPPPGTYDAYGGQNYYALQQQQRQYQPQQPQIQYHHQQQQYQQPPPPQEGFTQPPSPQPQSLSQSQPQPDLLGAPPSQQPPGPAWAAY